MSLAGGGIDSSLCQLGEAKMKRIALAAVVAGLLAGPAAAANCAKDYKDFWDKLDREGYSKMSG